MPKTKVVNVEVCKQFEFSAHHKLPYYRECNVDHGHNFTVTLCVEGLIQPDFEKNPESGMVVSFDKLKQEWEQINNGFLDHKSLNEFLLNPTCERLCAWLVEYFDESFSKHAGIQLSRLRVNETNRSWSEWTRK